MGDNLNKVDYRDDDRINIHQSWELRDWALKFGVSQEALKSAVGAAGVMAKNVHAWLVSHPLVR